MAQWFKLQGTPPGSPLDPSSYNPDNTPSCGSGTNSICAINAENNGFDQPVITEALKDEMILLLNARSHSNTNVVLRT